MTFEPVQLPSSSGAAAEFSRHTQKGQGSHNNMEASPLTLRAKIPHQNPSSDCKDNSILFWNVEISFP